MLRGVFFLGGIALLAGRLAAQLTFVAEHDGKMCPVGRMQNAHPYVVVDEKLVAADGSGRALVKGSEYLPVFVSIHGLGAEETGWGAGSHPINNEVRFDATFTTPYQLDDVFFVLELDLDRAGRLVLGYEVGTLEPRKPKQIAIKFPIKESLGEGQLIPHVFSGGKEVLTSSMDAEFRDETIDRMIAAKIAQVQSASPAPFVGPAPDYPLSLLKSKRSGRAVVTLRIGANGRVYDPVIKAATDPAFGEAALAAVRFWRFLPRVKNGQAVDSKINMPFDFSPPSQAGQ